MPLEMTDSQADLERIALIAVKETDLKEMDTDLVMAFMHLRSLMKLESGFRPGERDTMVRRNILDLRAVIEDILLSIRLTENELHEIGASGW